jgi:hypothetical protein
MDVFFQVERREVAQHTYALTLLCPAPTLPRSHTLHMQAGHAGWGMQARWCAHAHGVMHRGCAYRSAHEGSCTRVGAGALQGGVCMPTGCGCGSARGGSHEGWEQGERGPSCKGVCSPSHLCACLPLLSCSQMPLPSPPTCVCPLPPSHLCVCVWGGGGGGGTHTRGGVRTWWGRADVNREGGARGRDRGCTHERGGGMHANGEGGCTYMHAEGDAHAREQEGGCITTPFSVHMHAPPPVRVHTPPPICMRAPPPIHVCAPPPIHVCTPLPFMCAPPLPFTCVPPLPFMCMCPLPIRVRVLTPPACVCALLPFTRRACPPTPQFGHSTGGGAKRGGAHPPFRSCAPPPPSPCSRAPPRIPPRQSGGCKGVRKGVGCSKRMGCTGMRAVPIIHGGSPFARGEGAHMAMRGQPQPPPSHPVLP